MARITNSLKNRVEALEAVVASRQKPVDSEKYLRALHYLHRIPGFIAFSLDHLALLDEQERDADAEQKLKEMWTRIEDMFADAVKAVEDDTSANAVAGRVLT